MNILKELQALVKWCCQKVKRNTTVQPVPVSSYGIAADPVNLVFTVAPADLTITGNAPVDYTLTAGSVDLTFTVADAYLTASGSSVMTADPVNLVFTVAPVNLVSNINMRVDPVNLTFTVAPATLTHNPVLVAEPVNLVFTVNPASSTPPQYPEARLTTYGSRLPGGVVPGVDNYVGADETTATKTIESDGPPTGWDYRDDIKQIFQIEDDAELKDYNIGGHQIFTDGTYRNPTIENIVGSVTAGINAAPIRVAGSGGGTLRKISLNGNRLWMNDISGLINVGGIGGTWVFDQIALENSWEDGFQFATGTGDATVLMSDILVANNGWGLVSSGVHPDPLQFFGAQIIALTISGFTHIMNVDSTSYGSQGQFLNDAGDLADFSHQARFSSVSIDGLYQLYPVLARINYGLRLSRTQIRDSATVRNLYYDPTGQIAPWLVEAGHGAFSPGVDPTFINAVNLLTGDTYNS